jgi:repressor LexA
MKDLTDKQKQLYNLLLEYYSEVGYSPTLKELSEMLGVSIPAVKARLIWIEKKGYIKLVGSIHRGINIKRC